MCLDMEGEYFISDVHLRPLSAAGEKAKQRALLGFLRSLRGKARRLCIVGDLFDFWFEYRSVVPRRGGRVLAALAELAEDGTEVICFAGNHDWWMGSCLEEEYGLVVRHEPLWLETQGRRLFITHGDGFSEPSRTYAVVRRIIHHPLAVRAFRMMHPDWGGLLASIVAHWSRNRSDEEPAEAHLRPVYETLAEEAFSAGADIAVLGHVHAARIEVTPAGVLVVLGDWVTQRTYGELRDGNFTLRRWHVPEPLG